jgi:hypothetical protein
LATYDSYLLRLFADDYFQEKFIRMKELRLNTGWKIRPWREQIAWEYVHNVETSATISNAFDSAFAAFLQPTLLTKKTPTDVEQARLGEFIVRTEKSLGVSFADRDLHDEFIRNQISTRLSATQYSGLRFIDLSAEFDGEETSTYKDLIHIEKHANQLIAKRILESLREIITTNRE